MNKINKQDKVLDFIKRRFGDTDSHWQDGNCYYFSIILKDRFPKGNIMYDPVDNHFLFRYRGVLYDSKGVDKRSIKDVMRWDKYKEFDESDYNNVIKYCIL